MKELLKKWTEYKKELEKDNTEITEEMIKNSVVPVNQQPTMEGFMDWLVNQ